MCTVSWLHTTDGYELFCNRDERLTRALAWAPRIRERHGVRFIAPIDGESGGSWIGVNHFGLTVSLLNRYDALPSAPTAETLSRGWLVLELLASPTCQEVQRQLQTRRLELFPPFTLLALQANQPVRLFDWDGQQLRVDENGEARLPLTSSSFATASVVAARQQQFAQASALNGNTPRNLLENFHRSHDPAPSAFSVCMHRDNAQTVSYSHLCVSARHATFHYFPQAPCAAVGAAPYATQLELYAA